eukprot:11050408-Alexandrium_andersonii.AAC.1
MVGRLGAWTSWLVPGPARCSDSRARPLRGLRRGAHPPRTGGPGACPLGGTCRWRAGRGQAASSAVIRGCWWAPRDALGPGAPAHFLSGAMALALRGVLPWVAWLGPATG